VRKRRAGLRLCWIHVGGRGFGPRQMQLWMIQQETSEREEVIVVRFPLTRHRDTQRDREEERLGPGNGIKIDLGNIVLSFFVRMWRSRACAGRVWRSGSLLLPGMGLATSPDIRMMIDNG
jgi:hypothetical protein